MYWYADNAELYGPRKADIQDILLFGGIAISLEDDANLRRALENRKNDILGSERFPIKWNIRDLEKIYKKAGLEKNWIEITKSSDEWRRELINTALEYPFYIIIACLESHSMKRKIIKNRKTDLSGYVFNNALMRVAMHALEVEHNSIRVTLDWPDKGDPAPFNNEYCSAYNDGWTYGGHVRYQAGPLKNIGFSDHITFAKMQHSTMLQLTDLIVGSIREFFECAIGKRNEPDCLGFNLAQNLRGRIRGYPDNIFGRGISVASANSEFRNTIRDYIQRHLNN